MAARRLNGDGTGRERTVISIGTSPPPVQPFLAFVHGIVKQNGHHHRAGVQGCRQDVVIALPPSLLVAENVNAEHESDGEPSGVAHDTGRRHEEGASDDQRGVDVRDPLGSRKRSAQQPQHDREENARQEVVIETVVWPSFIE